MSALTVPAEIEVTEVEIIDNADYVEKGNTLIVKTLTNEMVDKLFKQMESQTSSNDSNSTLIMSGLKALMPMFLSQYEDMITSIIDVMYNSKTVVNIESDGQNLICTAYHLDADENPHVTKEIIFPRP